MNKIDKDLIQLWLNHPVTKLLKQEVLDELKHQEQVILSLNPIQHDKLSEQISFCKGRINQIEWFLGLDYETIEEITENEDE